MASLAPSLASPRRPLPVLIAGGALALALIGGGMALVAQVSGDRGIAPVASTTDIEVAGIEVNVAGDNAEDARQKGWIEAQRLAWAKIGGASMPDSRIASLVSAVVVEHEEIGPRRYIARLGVIFDRARAGGIIGANNARARSAPMLTLPMLISGGSETMFETRNPWQRAWAEKQLGASPIDYVRPSGMGWESLLLTAGQTGRRSRVWWNDVLGQFGAADVLVPIARLSWQYPGGPIDGHFTARYGPDNRFLGQFTLRAANSEKLPEMLNQAVDRFDQIFAQALANGTLRPDPTLALDSVQLSPQVLALIEASRRAEAAERAPVPTPTASASATGTAITPSTAPTEETVQASYVVQVATADAAAFDAAIASIRSASGVRGVAIGSTAIGGTSVMRVTFAGDIAGLASALRSRGWTVNQGSNALAISR